MLLSGSELFYGKIIGWKKSKVTRYLKLPIPTIKKHCGEYEEGLLLNIKWVNTHIPIGKKTVETPIFKKLKGTIKFRRYGKLAN